MGFVLLVHEEVGMKPRNSISIVLAFTDVLIDASGAERVTSSSLHQAETRARVSHQHNTYRAREKEKLQPPGGGRSNHLRLPFQPFHTEQRHISRKMDR